MKIVTSNEEIRIEAARWAGRFMDGNLTSAEREAFQRWLLDDESHAKEFRAHIVILNLVRDLPEAMRNEMVVDVEPKMRRRIWISGLAASLALIVGLAGWFAYQYDEAPPPHITTVRTARDVRLPDGSVAHLNVRTNLRWHGDSGERRITLLEGEALFDVKHDAAKPFAVVVDHSEIHVLGTRFNVRRRHSGDVVITVLEGTVRVSPQRTQGGIERAWTRMLHPNEQLVYNNTDLVHDVHAATRANAARWREGILEFEDETLSNIVDDLGRYTDRHILIRDQRLAQLRLGGQLDVRSDVKASLGLLERLAPVAVHESGNDFVLDHRQETTQERR